MQWQRAPAVWVQEETGMRAIVWIGSMLLLVGTSGCQTLRYHSEAELWAESDAAFDRGDYDDAIPYYDELLRRDDADTHALLMRGVSHERTGSPGQALMDYGGASRGGDLRAVLYRINLNIKRGDTGAAEEDLAQLKNAGLAGSDRVVQMVLIGSLRLAQGQPRMAAAAFEQAIRAGEATAAADHVRDAHYNAAQAYYQLGDFGRAYDHYLAATQGGDYGGDYGPDPVDAYMLGLLAYLAGDFDAAESHLAQADPDMVTDAAEVLEDPTFGMRLMGGAK